MTSIPFWRTVLLLAILSLMMAGCGKTIEVAGPEATGTVTLDGNPLTSGVLIFYPAGEGSSAFAKLNSEGKFRVSSGASATGIAPGKYVVTVEPLNQSNNDEKGNAVPVSRIPSKYTEIKTSDLTITVTEKGPNDFKLELKSK